MKFIGFVLIPVVAYKVVFGQPTTEEGGSCTSPDANLQDVAKQTTLDKGLNDVAQALKEVRDSVTVKPCTESSPLPNTNQIELLKRKTK